VDASTSWGLGIIIGRRRRYSFKLRQGWKQPGRDICWLEAIVIELLYHFLIQLQFRDIHLLIHSDNKAAIGALTKSRSPNVHMNLCARRAYALAADHMIVPKLTYVESKLNPADAPLADALSLSTTASNGSSNFVPVFGTVQAFRRYGRRQRARDLALSLDLRPSATTTTTTTNTLQSTLSHINLYPTLSSIHIFAYLTFETRPLPARFIANN
jgi:hypothetical protein